MFVEDAPKGDASGWHARKNGRMAFFNDRCCWGVVHESNDDVDEDDDENGRILQQQVRFWRMNSVGGDSSDDDDGALCRCRGTSREAIAAPAQ